MEVNVLVVYRRAILKNNPGNAFFFSQLKITLVLCSFNGKKAM